MWLGKKIASRQKEAERPVAGTISGEQNGGLLLQSSSEYREVAAAGPYGVKSLPPAGENAVGVVSGEKTFCLGVEIDPMGLQPGELVLFSSGGAKITLTRDGKIQLEGQVFINGAEQSGGGYGYSDQRRGLSNEWPRTAGADQRRPGAFAAGGVPAHGKKGKLLL